MFKTEKRTNWKALKFILCSHSYQQDIKVWKKSKSFTITSKKTEEGKAGGELHPTPRHSTPVLIGLNQSQQKLLFFWIICNLEIRFDSVYQKMPFSLSFKRKVKKHPVIWSFGWKYSYLKLLLIIFAYDITEH